MADDRVNHQGQHEGEHDKGDIFHPLGDRAGDDGRGGAAEHKLEEKFSPEGHGGGQRIVISRYVRTAEDEQVLSSNEGIVPSEHEPPAQKQKAQGGDGKDDEIFRQDVDRVFRPGKAGLHAGKPQIHKEHEDRREKHPQGVDE